MGSSRDGGNKGRFSVGTYRRAWPCQHLCFVCDFILRPVKGLHSVVLAHPLCGDILLITEKPIGLGVAVSFLITQLVSCSGIHFISPNSGF